MKTSFRIPLWRIFLNWLIAIVIGSILWPFLALFFKGGPNLDSGEFFGIIALSAILSCLTSIPAILLLLLTTWQLNKQQVAKNRYQLIHTFVHLLLAFATFFVLFIFSDLSNREAFFFLLVAFSYTISGVFSWLITFNLHKRKMLENPIVSDQLLDGGV